jgi:hypothetical protein
MNKTNALAACVAATLVASCGKTDEAAPTVCTAAPTDYSVLSDEIDAEAGEAISLTDLFCDNEGLGQVRWSVHNAAGHAHEEGEQAESEFILHSGTEWEVLRLMDLQGVEAEDELTLELPLSVRGVWHVQVSLVDAAGNAAEDQIAELHIANAHLPAFHLTAADGQDPASWEGEPTWAAGSTVNLVGWVADSDGVASAQVSLADEAAVTAWSMPLAATGGDSLAFDLNVQVPLQPGEWKVVLEAEDASGVGMETEFHVEVE